MAEGACKRERNNKVTKWSLEDLEFLDKLVHLFTRSYKGTSRGFQEVYKNRPKSERDPEGGIESLEHFRILELAQGRKVNLQLLGRNSAITQLVSKRTQWLHFQEKKSVSSLLLPYYGRTVGHFGQWKQPSNAFQRKKLHEQNSLGCRQTRNEGNR